MSSISVSRPQPISVYRTSLGAVLVNTINTYMPPYETTPAGGIACHLAAAFTPSGTSVTVNPTGDDAVTFTNAAAREFVCLAGQNLGAAKHFRAGARRKPGTSGVIVAQTVTFTVNAVELARFTVEAADAGVDPVSGSVEIVSPSGDARWGLVAQNIIVGVTAADADLEIFFSISGDD